MRIVVEMAGVWQADRLIDVTSAHVDSCLYHGPAGLDFAERLLAGRADVAVPDDPERLVARSAPPRAHQAGRRHGVEGAPPDGRVRGDGLPADLDLRAVSARTSSGVRRARRLGRVERDRVRQLGAGRADEPLRRLHRHLRGRHRPGAGGRPPPGRAPARPGRVPAGGRHPCAPASRRDHTHVRGSHRGGGFGNTRARHRRAPVRNERRSTESARGCGRVLGRRRDVPRGGDHARGADARSCARRQPCGARDRRHARASPRGPRRADDRRGWTHRRGQRRHAASLRRRRSTRSPRSSGGTHRGFRSMRTPVATCSRSRMRSAL